MPNKKIYSAKLIAIVLAGLFGSSLGFGQNMFYHLLGASEPVVSFSTTAQNFNEAGGTLEFWPTALSSWTRRRQIALVGNDGTVTDFPALVKLDATRVTYGSVQAAGQDLRFTDDNGNLLNFEIENWNASGSSNLWVKIPVLAAYPARTRVWMYYGNVSASDGQNQTSTWDASHAAVWHLNSSANDATAAARNGSVSGPTAAAGVASGAYLFTGGSNFIRPPDSLFANRSVGTLEGWFKTTASDVSIFGWNTNAYPGILGSFVPSLYIGSDGMLYGEQWNGVGSPMLGAGPVNDGNWHHVALVADTNVQRLYLDGVQVGSAAGTIIVFPTTVNYIGMAGTTGRSATAGGWRSFVGTLDEFRISSIARSADWIAATNLSVRDELATFHPEETQTSGAALVGVWLDSAPSSPISIPYTVSGTSTAGADHDRLSGTLIIPSGQTSGSLDVRVLRDELVEGSETAILTLGTPSGASLGTNVLHTVTIIDEALSPPDAVNDTYTITTISSQSLSVMLNDTDANGDPLLITSFTNPTAGTLARIGTTLMYTPSGDFGASDSFNYTISDGRGGSDTATVTLNYQIPFTWTGAGADTNWATGGNWIGGASPGLTDTAYFNDQCSANCNPSVTAAVSVRGLRLNTSYTGTISQGALLFTLGSSGYRQTGGTFLGGTANFLAGFGFAVMGGSFTAPSVIVRTDSGNFTVRAPGTFAANSGTLYLGCAYNTTCNIEPGAAIYNNVTFAGYYSWYNLGAGTMTVFGDLSMGDTYGVGYNAQPINNGTFNLTGNYNVINTGYRGTAVVRMAGNPLGQTITGLANNYMPRLTIDSGANQVTLVSDVGVANIYQYLSGTVVTTGSTLRVHCEYALTCAFTAGTVGYNNLRLQSYYGHYNLGGATVTVLGQLTIGDTFGAGYTNQQLTNGTFNVSGGISISPFGYGGNAVLNSIGGNSTISAAAVVGVPSGTFTVNKTADTNVLSLGSAVSFSATGQAFTISRGIVDLAGFNLGVNGLLTIAANSKLICNGGLVTAGSSSILGEISCGSSIGITWTGATGDGLWTTAGNWTNNTVPASTDIAIFTSVCGANCNVSIPSNLTVRGVTMQSTYTGTITQASGVTVTVGTAGWNQLAGNFAGSNAAVVLSSHLTLTGGTYTATSSTTTLGTEACGTKTILDVTSGTYVHSNGRLAVIHGRPNGGSCQSNARFNFPVGFTVYDFELIAQPTSGGWLSSASAIGATTLKVANRFYDYGPTLTFNLDVEGDIFLNNTNNDLDYANPTGVVRLMGTGNQTYTATGATTSARLKIDKTAGTVTAAGGTSTLAVHSLEIAQGSFQAPTGNLTLGKLLNVTTTMDSLKVAAGTTYDVNGSTTRFVLRRNATAAITGNVSVPAGFVFNHVELIGEPTSGGWDSVVTSATTLQVSGNLTFSGHVNNANWDVLGNLTVNGAANGGSGTINLVGTTNQTVTGISNAVFSKFRINSAGGIVTFVGTHRHKSDFTYQAGVVDPGTSTVHFDATYSTVNINAGTISFNNIITDGYVGTINVTGVVDVLGALTVGGTSSSPTVAMNGGTVKARANASFVSIGVSGTSVVQMAGAGNQTLSGAVGANTPSIEINSTGGTVSLSGTFAITRNYTHTAGLVDAGTSTLVFIANNLTMTTTPGPTVFNNVNFSGYVANYNLSGAMKSGGTLTLNSQSSSPAQSINTGALEASGNVVFSSSGSNGTSPLSLIGATATTLTITGSPSRMTGLISIAKTGGSILSLAQDSSFTNTGEDLTVTSGVLDLAGFGMNVADILTVSAGSTLRCNGGVFTNGSLVNAGTIECPGYSTYPFNWTGAAADGNWNTAANWQGGVTPTASSVVVFNNTYCGANCNATISTNTSVRGIVAESGYSSTLTQASGASLTVGSRGWNHAGGTFSGSNALVAVNSSFAMTGGTFNVSSAGIRVGRQTCNSETIFSLSGTAAFNQSTAMVTFAPTGGFLCTPTFLVDFPNGFTFADVTVDGSLWNMLYPGIVQPASGKTLVVTGNLTQTSGYLGGEWELRSNLTIGTGAVGGLGRLTFAGTGAQTYQSGATGSTSSVRINKATGTVMPIGTTSLRVGNFDLAQGQFTAPTGTMQVGRQMCASETIFSVTNGTTFDVNGGTMLLAASGSWLCSPTAMVATPAAFKFNNLIADGARFNGSYPIPIAGGSGQTIAANGNLSYVSGRMNGPWDIGGNISLAGSATAGNASITMSGTGDSTVGVTAGAFPTGAFVVNKTSGTTVTQTTGVSLSSGGQAMTVAANNDYSLGGFNLSVNGLFTNNGILRRGVSPSCGTVTSGSYAGTAPICPP